MRRLNAVARALLLSVAALALAACTIVTPTPAATEDAVVIHEATFTATEYSFDGPDTLTAGWNRLTLVNEGPNELHHAQFIRLPDGMTQEEAMAALMSPEPPAGIGFGGGPSVFIPGESGASTYNMAPGSYLVVCFIPDAEGVPHVAHGMVKFVTVEGEAVTAEPDIEADVTIELVDFAFVVPELTPGRHVIRVENRGPEPHELFMVQLAPGAKMEDVIAWTESPQGPPPGKPVGGVQVIEPGAVAFFEVELVAGDYGMACFHGSPAHEGAPHFALGMIANITVQ